MNKEKELKLREKIEIVGSNYTVKKKVCIVNINSLASLYTQTKKAREQHSIHYP